jgi:hypothetical protein
MLVYREAAERFNTADVLRSLQNAFRLLEAAPNGTDAAVAALITAGELECALTDAGSQAAPSAARLTDAAAACLTGSDLEAVADQLALLTPLELPTHLTIRPLEGFAYYGLHPTQYAAMARDLLRQRPQCRCAAVVGIRSIGAPLSAVVTAALRKEGIAAERITVRPAGHPSNRELQLQDEQARWIELQRSVGAEFLVVDEGPGRSGSSFLATAEALVRAGVEAQRISLLCSYEPDVASLIAPDGANRWRFRCLWPAQHSRPLPGDADQDLSGGAWRSFFYGNANAWPSSWTSTERLKYLSADRASILKFEGLGRYGDCALQRSSLMAEEGFGPACWRDQAGFVRYARVAGQPSSDDLNRETIHRLAEYCAFRARAFAAAPARSSEELERMAAHNLGQILGSAPEISLPVVQPVIADGRMMPHEWVRTASGVLLKTDAASHGDDHFYPGPTDIAWDLAGAIVEWRMPPAAAAEFLARYAAMSGDDASPRIAQYRRANLAFRISFLEMASQSCDEAERKRLLRDVQAYRAILAQVIPHPRAQSA